MYKLMIVDDSNIIRRKIRRAHDESRFELVAIAENGKDAVEMFQANQPDVITMDLTMPEMDGLECISQIMTINPDAMILVVSALSDKITGIEALERGARGFLLKPFTEDQLAEALHDLTDHLL